jgi:hypothetical protein
MLAAFAFLGFGPFTGVPAVFIANRELRLLPEGPRQPFLRSVLRAAKWTAIFGSVFFTFFYLIIIVDAFF